MDRVAAACLLAWLIPGAGHLFYRRWYRGMLFFSVVIVLFSIGLMMQGRLFSLESGFFGFLRFFADAAIGLPYLLAKWVGWGQGEIRAVGYEYGNTYLYTAGLVNMLLVVDTFDIGQGRKA